MPKKPFTLPFLSLKGKYSDSPPPESNPGQVILYFNKEDGKIFSSSDGSPYEPMDQQIRDSVFSDPRFIEVALQSGGGGATSLYFENGILKEANAPISLKNSNITIDSAGRIQGIGTSNIKVNNEKVFEDPRFVNVEQKTIGLESYFTQAENTIQLKASKIFFKYDGDNKPIPSQQIEITFIKGETVTGTPIISITPDDKGIQLTENGPDKYVLTVSEFNKAQAESIDITATLASGSGTLTDSVTIFKARDGMNSLVGGLTNPFVAIQVNSSGVVQGNFQGILNSAGGIFTVLKGTEDLTGDGSRISYSIENVPEAFLDGDNEPMVAISTSGAYSFTGFNVDELIGELTFIATDLLTGQQLKSKFTMVVVRQGEDGLPGATGSSSRTVKLTADDSQIAYRSDDQLLDPATITVQAAQQNHEGTVFYEFIVLEGLSSTEIVLRNSTSSTLVLTNTLTNYGSGLSYTFIESTKTGFGKSKTLKVRTREGGPTAAIKAEDTITIIATKDGSDALEVTFENNNHSFVADANGLVSSYSGGGSVVEAYIGNEQLVARASGAPSNGEFVVTINTQTDIVSGVPTIASGNPNRIIIGDPSGMPNNKDTASVTYTITGKSSNGVQKTQSIKASFSKSKQGITGSNGVGARSVELVSSAYQFNYDNLNQVSPPSFTLTATARGTTSANIKYKFYKDGVVLTSPSQPQASNTLGPITIVPTANSLTGYSVEMLEDDVVKATDSISIYGTKDGSDGITLIVPNDNHTVTTDSAGSPTTLAGSGTIIKLLIGSQPLTATASTTLSPGRFRATISATGIQFPDPAITVFDTNTLVLGEATAFSADAGVGILTVSFIRPGGSATETITRNLSYSKSKQGVQGLAGSNGVGARSVELVSNFYQFNYNTNDEVFPTQFTLTATPRGTTSTNLKYKFYKDGALVTSPAQPQTSNTLGPISDVPAANSGAGYFVELLEDDVVKATDSISIYGTKDGSDGLTLIVPNDNHTVTTDTDGVPSTLASSGTIIRLLVGSYPLAPTTSLTLTPGQFRAAVAPTGIKFPSSPITVSASDTTALLLADATEFLGDSASAVLTVSFIRPGGSTLETITRNLSYSKSKRGIQGLTGSTGTGARSVELTSNSYQFNYNAANQVSPTSFSLSATARGTTSSNIKYKFYKDGAVVSGPGIAAQPQTSNTLGPISSLPSANAQIGYSVELLEDDVVKANDSISIYGTKDGSDGITLVVPNDSHTVTTDSAGTPLTLERSGSIIKLLIGSQELNATTNSSLVAGQFRAASLVTTGITFPTTITTIESTKVLKLADAIAFGADSATAVLTVEFIRPGGSATETIIRNLSYSKSKQGTEGEAAIIVEVPNTNHTFPADSNGNVSASSPDNYVGSGTTIAVSLGSTPLTYVSGSTPGEGQFTVTTSVSPSNAITVPTPSGSGTPVATVGKLSSFSNSVDVATVTYTITVRRPGYSATETETFTRIGTYSKSKGGSSGIGARSVKLTANAYQFNYNSAGQVSPSSLTLTATSSGTTGTDIKYRFYKDGVVVSGAGIATQPQSSGTLGPLSTLPAANSSVSYSVELLEDGVVKANDSTSVNGTKDGSDGVTLSIPNDNHTVTAYSSGVPISLSDSGTDINLSVGSQALTATTNTSLLAGQFRVSSFTQNGITFSAIAGVIPVTATGPNTLTLSDAISFPAANKSASVALVVSFIRPNSTAVETIARTLSYSKSIEGEDAVTIEIPNLNHTFTSDSSGNISTSSPNNYTGSGTTIRALVGGTALTYTSGTPAEGQFAVSASVSPANAIIVPAPTGTGTTATIGDLSSFSNSVDVATVTYTITLRRAGSTSTETFTQKGTYSKSKSGSNGIGARSVELISSAYQINYNSSNQASPANFTLTATARGTDAGSVLKYRFSKNGTVLTSPAQPQDSNILGPISDLPAANALVGYSVELLEGPTSANLTARATDSVSLYGTKDGSDGITLIVPNDNHTVTTDSNGVPVTLVGSGSTIQLVVGSQGLLATTGTLSAGRFRASISGATGISFAASPMSVSSADATGKTLLLADATGFSGDTGTATLTVEFIRPGGSSTESVVRTLSYAKSKQGSDAITVNFSKPSHSFTSALDGTVSDFTNSGTSISVSVGSTALNYVSSLSGTTGQFTVTSSVSPANSLTVPTATGTGTPTAAVGSVSAGSAFSSSDTITVTYTITVRRPGTSGSETITRITSYSKSRQGDQGIQGPDGPEGGNPEDIGYFSSIYIKDNIKYPWGWGRTSGVSATLQTVLDSPTAAPVEEKLIYDPDLAGSVQANAVASKGGYVFNPQNNLAVTTVTFCYSRPIPIDRDIVGKMRFDLEREAATGMGTVSIGVFFLNESLQKLTASNGSVLHCVRAVTATSGTGILDTISTFTFDFTYNTSNANTYSSSSQTGTFAGGEFPIAGYSPYRGFTIPADARYAVPFIHISGATNSRITIDTARWWGFNSIQPVNNGIAVISKFQIDPQSSYASRTEQLIVEGSSFFNGNIRTNNSLSVGSASTPQLTINSTGSLTTTGSLSAASATLTGAVSAASISLSGNATVTGIIDVNSTSASTIRTLTVGEQTTDADVGRLKVYGWGSFYNGAYITSSRGLRIDAAPIKIAGASGVFAESIDGDIVIKQAVLSPTADAGNTNEMAGIVLIQAGTDNRWRFFINDNEGLVFTYNGGQKGYLSAATATGAVKLNFTGQHRSQQIDPHLDFSDKVGLIVVSAGEYLSTDGNSITINESLPRVRLSSERCQRSVFGVVSDKEDENSSIREYSFGHFVSVHEKDPDDNRLIINSLGEGAIWVTNINGNLQNGDYITTCEIPGYGMRQDDDLLHNYTVAKITCDCDFDLNSPIYICEEFEFAGQTYRRAFVGCTYHCG